MAEIGRIGQKRWNGVFHEEFLRELQGIRGVEVYREMANNDDTIGAILFAIKMLIRHTVWNIEPGGDSAKDREAAEFIESCMDDMQSTWTDILDEVRGKGFEFDATDVGIRNWIKDRGSEFVTNAVQEQKKAIQRLTMKAVREDLTPNELARVIRPCIGLTERQAQANLKYYNHIKEQMRKEHPRMKEENIVRRARDKALKYAEKQHRYRAETIAQTELAEAYNAGAHQGIKQAQERGYIGHVKKVWVTARQDNVCKFCESVEGVSKEMDEYFDVGKCGRVLIPPAHPRCRCVVKYVEVKEDQ